MKIINDVIQKLPLYVKLLRLNSPTGLFLLMWPPLWSVAFASESLPEIILIIKIITGSFLMRSAGCIINDIIDRKIDIKVKRTKNRPLASGELTLKEAFIVLIILLLLSLFLLLSFNILSIIIGFIAIFLVTLYPFMKRITYWPQLFLGIVFNLGILIAWAEIRGNIEFPTVILYIGSIFWTLGYDTIYGFQDINDDIRIGIKSTAIRLVNNPKKWIAGFYKIFAGCIFVAAVTSRINSNFYFAIIPIYVHLYWQVNNLEINNPQDCFKKFSSNSLLGLLLFTAIIFSKT